VLNVSINTSLAEKLSLLYVQSRKELSEMNRQQIFDMYSESLSQFSEFIQEKGKVHEKKLFNNFFESNEN
jgi:hypothetical protein